jgi:hypothetical protein
MNQRPKHIWETVPPWTKEQIRYSVFASFTDAEEALKQLPGAKIFHEIESLRFSLNIFLDSTEDLISSINIFKGEEGKPNFWDRPQRQQLEKLERSINRGLFSAITSAMALVDHSRKFGKKYPVESYQDKVDQLFSKSPQHEFIHSLRRYLVHVKMTKANWKIETSKEGRSVFFLLNQPELLKWKDWSSLARQYIQNHPNGVNVESLFEDYSKSVKGFHDWLRSQVWELHSQNLAEFLDYSRAVKRVSVHSTWNMLIQQAFIPKKINPYEYLDRYLTPPEIEEVLALEYRSKKQVDRIIEIVDEFKACDEKLMGLMYKFFKINTI